MGIGDYTPPRHPPKPLSKKQLRELEKRYAQASKNLKPLREREKLEQSQAKKSADDDMDTELFV